MVEIQDGNIFCLRGQKKKRRRSEVYSSGQKSEDGIKGRGLLAIRTATSRGNSSCMAMSTLMLLRQR
ncbi:galactoside 2-alpha-L-fucosyltransferase-like protein [Corchorus olitorius]|uniref:Galactoside 2-alpha-L-fucosyltransferase-like protein n=1 Tax=Corchorus olitorius TaxID=93759 RepID=A0A1R3KZ45_9ROSI|nr:galactoside 2-alpha-L-fucosyltransferase-like protein [Corchorus olitorius]